LLKTTSDRESKCDSWFQSRACLLFRDFAVGSAIKTIKKGAIRSMEDIEKVLEQIKEWLRKLIEGLLNPEAQPELEPIPIPVNEPRRRR
jgi:hypothetical protein